MLTSSGDLSGTRLEEELGWRERQKVVVKKRGKKLIIEDWEG